MGGDERSLYEKSRGGGGGGRVSGGKRVKTTLRSCWVERKPAAPEPRAEAGRGRLAGPPLSGLGGVVEREALAGKGPRPSDWGEEKNRW